MYAFFSLCICSYISAQNAAQLPAHNAAQDDTSDLKAGYFVDNSGSNPRIIQRFVWEKEEYALRYEISIQYYNNVYSNYIIENTEKNFFEVSLPPGFYRYSVTPFDLLGIRGDASEWKQFEVIAAYVPQITRFLPEAFYLDREQERVLNIAGVNIQQDSAIFLKNSNAELYPVNVTVINNERAVLVFDDKILVPGVYDIYIENPGDIGTMMSGFVIGYRKPLDIFIKAGYTPVIPIYGAVWEMLGGDLFLAGYSFGFEVISSQRSSFNGGLELSASVFFINSIISLKTNYEDYVDGLSYAGNGAFLADFDFNISLQKKFGNWKHAVTFRFGFGGAVASGFGNFPHNGILLNGNLSVTAFFKIYKILSLDIGIDYSHFFVEDHFGLIKPRLGLAWRF